MLHSQTGHGDGAPEVVLIIFQRVLDGFPHRLISGKVDQPLEASFLKKRAGGCFIRDIQKVEVRLHSGDGGDPLQHRRFGVAEVVCNGDLMACLLEEDDGMGPDISGSPGNEDAHGSLLYSFTVFLLSARRASASRKISSRLCRVPRRQVYASSPSSSRTGPSKVRFTPMAFRCP